MVRGEMPVTSRVRKMLENGHSAPGAHEAGEATSSLPLHLDRLAWVIQESTVHKHDSTMWC